MRGMSKSDRLQIFGSVLLGLSVAILVAAWAASGAWLERVQETDTVPQNAMVIVLLVRAASGFVAIPLFGYGMKLIIRSAKHPAD